MILHLQNKTDEIALSLERLASNLTHRTDETEVFSQAPHATLPPPSMATEETALKNKQHGAQKSKLHSTKLEEYNHYDFTSRETQ